MLNNNNKKVSFDDANDLLRQYGADKITRWAQSDNLLLKACAIEVLDVAGVK